jgi:hypothetical protein
MMQLELYTIVALLTVVVVLWLVRRAQRPAPESSRDEQSWDAALWSPADLILAERVFDRTDYLWLRDEAGFPALAKSLRRSRAQMALAWLRAVRRSFEKLLQTPGPVPASRGLFKPPRSWEFMLRFHLVLGYAFLVVRFFGPYHRLVPPFGWIPNLSGRTSTSRALESVDAPPST